jgi:5-methylcytosine-specific restriction endonuclease McrA
MNKKKSRIINKTAGFFELFPEDILLQLVKDSEIFKINYEIWENTCENIKNSCKKHNDDLMQRIKSDEQAINKDLYNELNRIKNSIDEVGQDINKKFIEQKKWLELADNEKNILLIFRTEKKDQALYYAKQYKAEIETLVNQFKQLWWKLIEHIGGHDCVRRDNNDHLSKQIPSLIHSILSGTRKLSSVLNGISCFSPQYEHFLNRCPNKGPGRNHVYFHCYNEPIIKYQLSSLRSQLKDTLLPEPPNPLFVLKSVNIKEEITLLDKNFDINVVREVIDKKEKKRHEYDSVKALAAAHLNKTRSIGDKVKKGLQSQIKIVKYCPYCGKRFGDSDVPHADHIYPVSKGGLSTSKNMIYICSTCNIKKANKTLREFIIENNLDRDRIEKNLELLKKTF